MPDRLSACLTLALLPGLLLAPAGGAVAQPVTIDPALLSGLKWRTIGPDGNRLSAATGEWGNPDVIYFGAASGGIWKSSDRGVNWEPVFDDQDAASISALAVSPSHSGHVWAGTGETFIIRPALAMGNGIYRSTDAGRSFHHRGLEATGRIARILVHPEDPDLVYACALGHSYAPQPERGVYRTRDGGASWELVLHVDENTGCSDLAMDLRHPERLLAGMWQLQINTGGLQSGGPGSGVYRSRDGGDTWERLSGAKSNEEGGTGGGRQFPGRGRGLPGGEGHPIGKVAVGIAPSDPDRWYALIEDESPGFYRSDDGGDAWRLMMTDHDLAERAPYYVRLAVDSADADRVYFASVLFSTTVDGGRTLVETSYRAGGDNHDVWVDPWMPERILVGHDGGGSISENRGESWRRVVPPVAQMYHVTVDDRIPYRVYGNRQDGYSYRGPSRTSGGGIPLGLWEGVGGCESGWATSEPHDDNVVWSGCYDGGLEVYDERTGHVRDVRVWPEAGYGWAPADLKVRWHWNFPMVLSRHEPGTTWVGSQFVHESSNRGQSWTTISPDLTTNDKSRQQDSGGVTVDNLYTFDGSVLFALAESPVRAGQLWAGSVDGKVQVTTDGGETWLDRSGNVPGLDQDGWIKFIEPSHHDPETAYVAVSWHQSGDFRPHIFRTRDLGESWERISGGIPESPFSFVHVVREDPKRAGVLFAGTDNRVWASLDDGASWFSLQLDMPPAPIYGIVIQERFDDLVVATYGRGFFILDGIGPLRGLAEASGEKLRVFDSPTAWRFLPRQSIKSEPGSLVTGRNPPYGAAISWWLDEDAAAASAEVAIVDGEGEVVRTLQGPGEPGLSRVNWDLRGETPGRAVLRTRPPDRDWVELGEDGERRIRTWDLDIFPGYRGLLLPPGSYTARVTVGDHTAETTLQVEADPASAATSDDILAKYEFLDAIHAQLNELAEMVDELEWVRREIEGLQERHASDERFKVLLESAGEIAGTAIAIEGRFFDVGLTGAREDAFRAPMRLYGRLGALANDAGWDGADFAPTDQQREVHAILSERFETARAEYRQLMEEQLPPFWQALAEARGAGAAPR